MFVLGDEWQNGYLDYSCDEGQVRIQVQAWMVIRPISGMYFERARSMRLIWEYAREIGLRTTVCKIFSRMNESLRNKRYFSIGLGRVAPGSPGQWPEGTTVAFIAPSHPRCVERIALPGSLVKQVDEPIVANVENHDGIVWCEGDDAALAPEELCGWQLDSGTPLLEDSVKAIIDSGIKHWDKLESLETKILPLKNPSPISTKAVLEMPSSQKPQAALFGLGNYAKTAIVGSVGSRIRISNVHEIDPIQIGRIDKKQRWSLDTSPSLADEDHYDAYFIAGYHHTHADLAIAALEQGAYAVVEKPLVTNADQLSRLAQSLKQNKNKLFACFHMRYNPLFALAKQDLGVAAGEPIHYYGTVFEVPLPERHWYNWPNSCSHLVSNGCHWLDHFLHMNDYTNPVEWRVWKSVNGDSQVGVELENGAVLGLTLTHAGSSRIGVQDHVELRANGHTVTVDCGSRYVAESPSKIFRKRRVNKMVAYRTMYKTIADKIAAGEPGDSLESILKTHELMLAVEEQRKSQ